MAFVTTLRENVLRIARDRWRRRLLVAWVAFGVFELLFSLGLVRRPSVAEAVLELAVLAAVGVAHAAHAPDDWRASAMWPAALGTALAATRFLGEAVVLAFDSMKGAVPFFALSFFLLAYLATRFLDRLLWRRVPALALSAALPLLVRVLLVGPAQTFGPFVPEREATAEGPPVVVITVDALRADAGRTMRSYARLAARGAAWERASAASSWTWPSIVSLWSGVDVPTHGAGRKEQQRFGLRAWSDDLPMLPAELRARGYATAAFVTNPMLGLMPLEGMFDHFRLGNTISVPLAVAGFPGANSDGGDGADVVDAAIAWIEDAPASGWLAWVHLYEPHLPYRHASNPALDYDLLRNARSGEWHLDADARREVREAYLGEVAYADRQLERLLDVLEARGVLDRGIVVLTADHGEELWEHGGFEHGHSHHGEVTDIPLVLVGPGVAPARRGDVAALEDVAPTVRAMLGLPADRGVDLRAPVADGRVVHLAGNLYYGPMRSHRGAQARVIVEGDEVRAYDLAADPGERRPLTDSAAVLQELTQPRREAGPTASEPRAARSDPPPERTPGEDVELDVAALRALGYVH